MRSVEGRTVTQSTLRRGRSLWLPPASRLNRRYRILSGVRQADVAVVGGGMTGALVAHAFASAGVSTAVIEAGPVGSGSTAASSALLLQEPDLELAQLEARYGRRTSRRIWRLSHDSVSGLTALLRRLRIQWHLENRDRFTTQPPQKPANACVVNSPCGDGLDLQLIGSVREIFGT